MIPSAPATVANDRIREKEDRRASSNENPKCPGVTAETSPHRAGNENQPEERAEHGEQARGEQQIVGRTKKQRVNHGQIRSMEEWIIPVGQESFAREQCATRHELMLIHIQPAAHRDRAKYQEHQCTHRDCESDLFAGHFRCNSGQRVRRPNESAPLRSEERLRRVIRLGRKFVPGLLDACRVQTYISILRSIFQPPMYMDETPTGERTQVSEICENQCSSVAKSFFSLDRSPKIAVPMRTSVAPSSTAIGKSCVMPMES
jgi:hypothetical protein